MRTGRSGDRDFINENLRSELRDAIVSVSENEDNINSIIANLDKITEFNAEDKSAIFSVVPALPSIRRLSNALAKVENVDQNMTKLMQVANNILTLKKIPDDLEEVEKFKDNMCYLVNQTKKYLNLSKETFDKTSSLINTMIPHQQALVALDGKLSNELTQSVQTIENGHQAALKLLEYQVKIKPCVLSYETRSYIEYDDVKKIMTFHIPRAMCGKIVNVNSSIVQSSVNAYLATLGVSPGSGLTQAQVDARVALYHNANPQGDGELTDAQIGAVVNPPALIAPAVTINTDTATQLQFTMNNYDSIVTTTGQLSRVNGSGSGVTFGANSEAVTNISTFVPLFSILPQTGTGAVELVFGANSGLANIPVNLVVQDVVVPTLTLPVDTTTDITILINDFNPTTYPNVRLKLTRRGVTLTVNGEYLGTVTPNYTLSFTNQDTNENSYGELSIELISDNTTLLSTTPIALVVP